jgi:hypothetical protein
MTIPIPELPVSSGEVPIEEAHAFFQQQWATYQKLVEANCLSHRELGDILKMVVQQSCRESFVFMDLACGDAHFMAQILSGTTIGLYRGIDLSKPALELAAHNLKHVPFEVELVQGDMVDAIHRLSSPVDVIFCSLSIHHLNTDEKLDLMKSMRQWTRRFVMLYEPTCAQGEDRAGYLSRFCSVNQKLWNMLSAHEWQQIQHHVTTCDLPETAEVWEQLGLQAGFSSVQQLYCNPTDFLRIYRYDVT